MLAIEKKKLMIVAGVVWLLAGLNIANIGVQAYLDVASWPLLIALVAGSLAVFALFYIKIFSPMTKKHAGRILSYTTRAVSVFRFFDVKGYLIMALMMTVGIGLRLSGVVPEWFIAFFYTGLGSALAVSGAAFFLYYHKSVAHV